MDESEFQPDADCGVNVHVAALERLKCYQKVYNGSHVIIIIIIIIYIFF